MTVQCSKCKEEIPEGRLKALPGTTVCVSCSNSKMKRAITITGGEREDTFNDLIILEADEYEYLFGKDKQTGYVFPDDDNVEDAES